MTLLQFMTQRKLADDQMAALVGVSASAIRKWKYGQRVPRRAAMGRLIKATEGAVTPSDFIDALADIPPQETCP